MGLFALDQITKYFAEKYLTFYQDVPVFPGLSLIKVHNMGAAYGILQNQQILIGGVSITLLLLGWIFRHHLATGPIGYIGLAIITSGALGNLSDRIIRGYVVDMFDIRIIPVFNIADVLINIGIAALIYDTCKKHDHT
jgi:signal peptidase II